MVAQSFKQPQFGKSCYFSLACSIGSISIACGSLLQIPNTTDRISLQRGLFLSSLGFIYFVSLTDFCNKYLLETQRGLQFRKKYHLMMSDVMEITNKVVSAIQASFSFLVGFIICKSTCSKSFVYASHFLMEAYGWFGTAYFMYDIWSMYKVHTQKIADKLKLMHLTATTNGGNDYTPTKEQANGVVMHDKQKIVKTYLVSGRQQRNSTATLVANSFCAASATKDDVPLKRLPVLCDSNQQCAFYNNEYDASPKTGKLDFLKYVLTHPIMMIHHVFIGTFGLLVVTYIRGGGHCIYSYMFMMEFSTPFVSLRSILSTMSLKNTRIYIVNGLVMLGTFFVCRVCMWPYVMWRYSIAIDTSLLQATIDLPRGCIISILILFLPQIYWFFLMVKGALKVFFPAKSQKASNAKIMQQSKNNNLSPIIDHHSMEFNTNGQIPTNGKVKNQKILSPHEQQQQ